MAEPIVGSRSAFRMDFESALGTAKGTTTPKKIAIVGETLSGTQNLITNTSIRPDGNRATPVLGNVSASGTITFNSTLEAAGWLLKLFFHQVAESTGTPNFTSTYLWNITSVTFRSAIFEVQYAASLFKLMTGARIKKIGIKFMSEGFLQWNIEVVGLTCTKTTATVLPGIETDWTASVPFHGLHVAAADMKLGGGAVTYVSELEIDPNVNLDENDYRLGQSGARSGLAVGAMDLGVKLKVPVIDSTQFTLMQSSSPTSVDITYTQAANQSLRILVPAFTIKKTLPNITTDGAIYTELDGIASYDASTTSQLSMVLKNQSDPAVLYV